MKMTSNSKRLSPLAAFALVLVATSIISAQRPKLKSAQTPNLPQGTIEYTSKFTCGTAPPTKMVEPGTYATTINIHNPALPIPGAVVQVSFYKKAVETLREPATPLAPGSFIGPETLQADYTMEVDCTTITTQLLPANPGAVFVEGWVVIYSLPTLSTSGPNTPNPLDVMTVYTDMLGAMELKPAKSYQF